MKKWALLLIFTLWNTCLAFANVSPEALGEKLFQEYRFSQNYFEDSNGAANKHNLPGDPQLHTLDTIYGPYAHPQRGQYFSCSSCHMLNQTQNLNDQFVLSYNDLAPRTKIPLRDYDSSTITTRNSMNLVLSASDGSTPLHWDGEFYSIEELSCAGLTGRNMGWNLTEVAQAKKHIVHVLKADNGTLQSDILQGEAYKLSYKKLNYDFDKMTDKQILSATCKLMGAYQKSLDFSKDKMGNYNGSSYDQFLAENDIRRRPKIGESSQEYIQYLRDHLNYKVDWKFISRKPLKFHTHDSKFERLELRGMQLFFTKGQCIACHTPPTFTNSNFHNTGISQLEYDKIHGKNAFAKIKIPTLKERESNPSEYLIPTEKNPMWQGIFRKAPSLESPGQTDLGLWNVFAHPHKQKIQPLLRESICASLKMPECPWSEDEFLSRTPAMFKTPTLRSLGQSEPYFHDGSAKSLRDVMAIYLAATHLSRQGDLINGDPMLKAMHFTANDFDAFVAFLRSLNEDYQ